MTTIAFDGLTIAFDTQIGHEYKIALEPWMKIRETSGSLYQFAGGSGLPAVVDIFINWVIAGHDKDCFPSICVDKDEHCTFIAITRDGYWHRFSLSGIPYLKTRKLETAGTGGEFALGAMMAGANAEEAVCIAAKLDPHTGGQILSYSVNPKVKAVNA